MGKRLAAAVVTGLVLVTAAACGDDDISGPDAPGDKPGRIRSEYADMQIYYQEATFNGVDYTCLLAGYEDAPAMWCERDEDGDSE